MDVVFSEFLTVLIISVMVGTVGVYIYGIIRVIRREKENKPIIEKGKKAIEERREKLGLDFPRIPLYLDFEKLDALFNQSQMRKSSMKIESIKKITSHETNGELDAKIAKAKISETESQEQVWKEYENWENKYVNVLSWLCEQDSLAISSEETDGVIQTTRLMKVIEEVYDKAIKEAPSQDFQDVMDKLYELLEKTQNRRLDSFYNKLVFVKGDFKLIDYSDKDFDLVFSGEFQFYVKGMNKYCTETGQNIFTNKGEITKSIVFGYVNDINVELLALKIEPIAIHRLLS